MDILLFLCALTGATLFLIIGVSYLCIGVMYLIDKVKGRV